MIKASRKWRTTLSNTLLTAGLLGIVGYGNSAHAAKQFFDLKVILPSNGEIFNLKIETKGKEKTVSKDKYTAPSNCEPGGIPGGIGDCPSVTSVKGPQLKSPAYTFTGYKVVEITGTAFDNGTLYDVWGPGYAENSGVFNYPDDDNPVIKGKVKADSIPHSKPDQLFNPRGLGLGFDPTDFDYGKPAAFTGFPADAIDNYFSFGGITFDIGHLVTPGDYTTPFTFVEPYQLFTVAYDSTSTTTGESLLAGDYAGCPGSCRGAVIPTPGPLPLLGVGAAFGFSRNLRKRIKTNQREVINAIA